MKFLKLYKTISKTNFYTKISLVQTSTKTIFPTSIGAFVI